MKILEKQWKSMKIHINRWKSMKIYVNLWKSMKINENQWKSMEIYEYLWKSMKIYENLCKSMNKSMRIYGNPWKSEQHALFERARNRTQFRAISSDYVTNIGLQIEATNTISVKIEFDLDFGAISISSNRQIFETQRGRRQRR